MTTLKQNLLFLLLFCYSFMFCLSKDVDTLRIQRINTTITLDGLINEPAWGEATPIKPVMQYPIFGKDPTERTEILIAYDDNYLYVAGMLYDKEPDKIQATSYKRDVNDASSEWFGVALDTYNDKENAVAFFTTPTGLRWDASVLEGSGGILINENWNTYWDVATQQNNKGWFAEFRISFSSLRFQEINGTVTMGIISWRLVARKNEWIIFPPIPDNWPTSFYKISMGHEIAFNNINKKNPVYITPYALAGKEEINKLNKTGTYFDKQLNNKYEIGFDIKYGITSNLTFDGTINTDFSQVEVDDQIISLDQFSVYVPEKRQFFLERTSNFDFTFDQSNQVFYSRQIGIQNEKLVRIYGGGRIVGREGNTDIGLLNLQTAPVDTIPSQNIGVLRLKKQILNTNSYIGGISTTKIGTDGNYNVVYGMDGIVQIKNDDYLKFTVAHSNDSKINQTILSHNSIRYHFQIERRSINKFSYHINTSYLGKNYYPALGFENWQNYQSANTKLQYSWLANDTSLFYRSIFNILPNVIWNNSTNDIDLFEIIPSFSTSTKSGFYFSINNHYKYENVLDTLYYLNDIIIPKGQYRYNYFETEMYSPDVHPFESMISIKKGSFYDGTNISMTLLASWNVSRHIELESRYQLDKINIDNRKQEAISHLLRFKTLLMYNTKLSLAAFVQYSNIENITISNIRLRYNPKEGNDLYIVYNHGLNVDRSRFEPLLPVTKNWNISLKYIYTFIL